MACAHRSCCIIVVIVEDGGDVERRVEEIGAFCLGRSARCAIVRTRIVSLLGLVVGVCLAAVISHHLIDVSLCTKQHAVDLPSLHLVELQSEAGSAVGWKRVC